jgi:hypothetical protein
MSDAAEILEDLIPPAERTRWGPFSPAISHSEMLCRLIALQVFVQCFVKPEHPLHDALWRAESGSPEDLDAARLEFDRLPALKQRDILGSYARHWRRRTRRKSGKPTSEEWR